MRDGLEDEERNYEVQENHGLARGLFGGALLVGVPMAICVYYGRDPWLGWLGSVAIFAVWDFCRYRG